jgi:hypothetical protein
MTKQQLSDLRKSALYRGIRSVVLTFAGIILSLWIQQGGSITGLFEVLEDNWNTVGGSAIISGLLATGLRRYVDPSNIPSLTDPPVDPPVDDPQPPVIT